MGTALSQGTRLELLRQVPETLRAEIAPRLRMVRANKGRALVEKGSRSGEVFFLLEGEAEVVIYSSSGREVWVHRIGPGDAFGEISALDGEPRSASVVALTKLVAVVMRAEDFRACVEHSPAAALWLARRLASGVRRLTERVFELSALNVRTRIYCELLRLAREGKPLGTAVDVRPSPTHAELATRIGSHREAVTREMRALAEMNVIRYDRRRLLILNLDRLERMVDRQP